MEPSAYEEFRQLEERHWWFMGRKKIFTHMIRWIASRKDSGPMTQALDLGCGMGAMLGSIGESCEHVTGTDISQDSLEHCKSRGFTSLMRSKGDALPVGAGTLDLICAFDTLEHIPEEHEALLECYRALRPGGWVFFSLPAYQFLYTHQDKVVHHQRRYTATGLKRKLRAAGFEPVKVSYINFFLFPVILPVVLFVKAKQAIFPPTDNNTNSNVSIRIPGWLNRTLYGIFAFERHIITRLNVPAGHSLVGIARKPKSER